MTLSDIKNWINSKDWKDNYKKVYYFLVFQEVEKRKFIQKTKNKINGKWLRRVKAYSNSQSCKTLASLTGVAASSCAQIIRNLEKEGRIEISRLGYQSNSYRINLDKLINEIKNEQENKNERVN